MKSAGDENVFTFPIQYPNSCRSNSRQNFDVRLDKWAFAQSNHTRGFVTSSSSIPQQSITIGSLDHLNLNTQAA
jgi:hypothetical protein